MNPVLEMKRSIHYPAIIEDGISRKIIVMVS